MLHIICILRCAVYCAFVVDLIGSENVLHKRYAYSHRMYPTHDILLFHPNRFTFQCDFIEFAIKKKQKLVWKKVQKWILIETTFECQKYAVDMEKTNFKCDF